MAIKKKSKHTKVYAAIILVAILAIATGAIVYTSQKFSHKASLVGVQVGDTFTYNITGSCSDVVPTVDYPGFYQLNDTQYYKVTVTGIQGDNVTLKTDWVFVNGTDIAQQQTIDLSNGLMTDGKRVFFSFPFQP